MRVIDCEQRSPEWFQARCGIPTASQFSRIITPTGQASKQAHAYMAELLAEIQCGPLESYTSDAMARGTELEPQALAWYQFATGADGYTVGMCLTDDGTAGCSPDALPGNSWGLEIKCLSPANHVLAQLSDSADAKYRPQIQGSMWITGNDGWDLLYYHPEMEPILRPQARDEAYIAKLADRVRQFSQTLNEHRERMGI